MPYAVTVGMEGGYLPGSVYHARTKREAESVAVDEARVYREDWDTDWIVEGSARTGGYRVRERGAGPYRLDTLILISEIPWEDFEPEHNVY